MLIRPRHIIRLYEAAGGQETITDADGGRPAGHGRLIGFKCVAWTERAPAPFVFACRNARLYVADLSGSGARRWLLGLELPRGPDGVGQLAAPLMQRWSR